MKLWCCLTWWHQGLKVQPSRQQVSCMYISYCSTSYMVLNKYQDTNNLIAEVQFLLFLRFLLWQSPAGHCRTASASAHHWTCRCLNCKCKPARVAELKTIYIYIVKVPVCRFGAKEVLIQRPSVQFWLNAKKRYLFSTCALLQESVK